ncbi:MAG TPA: tRNA epoxyqueuosine(34) reductase QueG [Candidatus Binataceae bacterium]|nr:tRNA epoxyqueuosine(34) reductase QueG [Candidatus Binataceae bacterium]
MARLEQILTAAAHAQGFVLIGFAPLRRLDNRAEFFNRWLAEGRQGEMGWLARDPERRFDPRRIDPRLRSVVSLGYPYAAPAIPDIDWRAAMRGRIAAYALGPDYHDTVLARARAVAARLKSERPDAVTRAYVDTGAVFEREWAAEARIGWFGRNTNLLNRHHGSYFFLAEIFTDAEFEPSGEPYREHCGTCRQCLDLCPTGALAEGYVIEPRVCISYLTIEHRGPIPAALRAKLGNWIFGCDVCQEVCPWNVSAAGAPDDALMPFLPELMALDDDGFRRRFGRSAVARTRRRGLLRNAAVVLGNSGNPDAVVVLARSLGDEIESLVRSHAAWALGRLGGASARATLERRRKAETDPEVGAEIAAALAAAAGEAPRDPG